MTETARPPHSKRWLARIPAGFWLTLAVLGFCTLPVFIRCSPLLPHSQQQAYEQVQSTVSNAGSQLEPTAKQVGRRWQHCIQKRWASVVEFAGDNDSSLRLALSYSPSLPLLSSFLATSNSEIQGFCGTRT